MNELLKGKVKTVFDTDDAQRVLIRYEDKVTAWNGKHVEYPKDKGATCCLISALLFEKMEKESIKTHYIDCPSLNTMLCKKLTIIPVEVIVRNIAAGSIVKTTTINEGTFIQPPLVEYFLKDDAKDDPLLTYDRVRLMGIDPEPMKVQALEINYQLQSLFTLSAASFIGSVSIPINLTRSYVSNGSSFASSFKKYSTTGGLIKVPSCKVV